MKKGFTLVEVLTALIIMSMIIIISSNILQTSLETERKVSTRLDEKDDLKFSSILIRRDLRQIINVPLLDFNGDILNASFIGDNTSKSLTFNSQIKNINNNTSPIKRITYSLKDNQFTRKQFYASNPYNLSENIETVLLSDVSEINFQFFFKDQWYSEWPINQTSERTIPKLIKIEFIDQDKNYLWLIEPSLDYVFQK